MHERPGDRRLEQGIGRIRREPRERVAVQTGDQLRLESALKTTLLLRHLDEFCQAPLARPRKFRAYNPPNHQLPVARRLCFEEFPRGFEFPDSQLMLALQYGGLLAHVGLRRFDSRL